MALRQCRYDGKCCMRDGFGRCVALCDTHFRDGECHFQKRTKYGVNIYDAVQKMKKRRKDDKNN